MFSLRTTPSTDKSDEECFGWWIGDPLTESQQTKVPHEESKNEAEELEDNPDEASSTTSCDDELCQLHNDTVLDQMYNLVELDEQQAKAEEIELNRLDSGFDESNNRQSVCYTPERLVKCKEFRILTPSPRFFSPLENLTTHNKTDLDHKGIEVASHLASLLLDTRRNSCRQCCDVRYGDGEVLLHNNHKPDPRVHSFYRSHFVPYTEFGSCYELKKRLGDVSNSSKDQELADDTSGISSSDGGVTRTSQEDDWSCTEDNMAERPVVRRLSNESNYVSLEYTHSTPAHGHKPKQKSSDISEVITILAELENDPSRVQALLVEDDRFHSIQSNHDCLGRLALAIEPDDKSAIRDAKIDPEAELELLYDKIERLQSSGKDIWEEIHSLRRDFTKVEWKVDHLSKDITKLHNEFNDLRYLDDLVKLLSGDLDIISKRNWPFVIGHGNYEKEEVNLVI